MSQNIELHILGQSLRLNCPAEQHDALREAAAALEQRVNELKQRSGILQLDKILAIVGLNLSYELAQEKQKNHTQQDLMSHRIQQLDHSLTTILANSQPAGETTRLDSLRNDQNQ